MRTNCVSRLLLLLLALGGLNAAAPIEVAVAAVPQDTSEAPHNDAASDTSPTADAQPPDTAPIDDTVPIDKVPIDKAADEAVYSGPQPGEPLPSFTVRGVFDADAGQELDFVKQADGKPIVLIFVHDVNRPSIAMTRVLSGYTHSRAGDGLATGIVWLDDDATEAENTLKRIRHALTPQVPTGISMDGREGPGSYGLNRSVTLTILVGHKNQVTANFALIQPSLQVDLPKVLAKIVEVAGGEMPKLQDLAGMPQMMRGRESGAEQAAPNEEIMSQLRGRLRPVIQRDATDEEVDAAAAKVEAFVADNLLARREVGRIAKTIVNSDKLTNYGTAHAQDILRKWAEQYGNE